MKKYHGIALSALCLFASLAGGKPAPEWDSARYIRVDEIRKEMPAYCLTVLEGEKTEKFKMKVLSILRNTAPGRDMILVVGTDERFKQIGSVHGCSGSPVFIDGKMAGALSAGWDGALDPLYMVTPIEYMLAIDQDSTETNTKALSSLQTLSCVETSLPLNIKAIREKAEEMVEKTFLSGVQLPLTTNLSARVCRKISDTFKPAGLVPLQAGAALGTSSDTTIEPGGVLALPVCSGDIRMAVVGTATEVVGDKVYAFGHPFTGTGVTALPISAGTVHTVVVTRDASFKLASAGPIVGTLRFDRAAGVVGQIGQTPPLIDLEVKVKRFDDPRERTFQCKIARDRQLTPMILRSAIAGAALNQGDLPPEHNVRYRCEMTLENGHAIRFDGFSSQASVQEPAMNLFALTAALMNNPFQSLPPRKINLAIDIRPENRTAGLWEARISNAVAKPGDTVRMCVAVKEFRSEPKEFWINVPIPSNCPEGKYALQICGVDAYQNFLLKTAPQRFMVTDAKSLLEGLEKVLNIPGDRIYVCMPLTPSGISIRNTELAGLPPSKAALLTESKRLLPTIPFQNFIETSVGTGLILSGTATVELTIDKNL
ncbi:MAG: hypothetical protein FJ263_11065 [Planctomycetes bacterium]|nr:hypothetical protein [Planctomycetota bacterium]